MLRSAFIIAHAMLQLWDPLHFLCDKPYFPTPLFLVRLHIKLPSFPIRYRFQRHKYLQSIGERGFTPFEPIITHLLKRRPMVYVLVCRRIELYVYMCTVCGRSDSPTPLAVLDSSRSAPIWLFQMPANWQHVL